MKVAAIAIMAAKGNEDAAGEQGERPALILHRWQEAPLERARHVDRPAGLDRPVGERKGMDFMARLAVPHDHGVEIEGRARRIDDRGAGHANERNNAAGERRVPDRLAQRALPDLRAAPGVDRGDLVVVVRHDEHARARPGGRQKSGWA